MRWESLLGLGTAPRTFESVGRPLIGALLLSLAGLSGCVEEGETPNCPWPSGDGDALDEDWRSSPEFLKWRRAMEKAGCLTPLGGTQSGGAGGDGSGDGDGGS